MDMHLVRDKNCVIFSVDPMSLSLSNTSIYIINVYLLQTLCNYSEIGEDLQCVVCYFKTN